MSPEAHLEQHNHKILLLWIYQKAAACDKSIQCTHSEAETSKYEITWLETILYLLSFFCKTVHEN